MMKSYVFHAVFEPGGKSGIVVSFPDVPEAVTQGRDVTDALAMAEEALGMALLSYPLRGLPLPKAKTRIGHRVPKGSEVVPIVVAADVAAKLAVLEAFVASGISKVEFAHRLGKDEKEVRRILDPRHPTKLPALAEALRALGKRLVVSVEEAA